MNEKVIKGICYIFAVIAFITAPAALVLGTGMVPDAQLVNAAVDNELRFFSAFWLAYGAFCFWVTRDLKSRVSFIPALALTMFVAGVGRLLSTILVGQPPVAYLIGIGVELIVPFIWYACYIKYMRNITVK